MDEPFSTLSVYVIKSGLVCKMARPDFFAIYQVGKGHVLVLFLASLRNHIVCIESLTLLILGKIGKLKTFWLLLLQRPIEHLDLKDQKL